MSNHLHPIFEDILMTHFPSKEEVQAVIDDLAKIRQRKKEDAVEKCGTSFYEHQCGICGIWSITRDEYPDDCRKCGGNMWISFFEGGSP